MRRFHLWMLATCMLLAGCALIVSDETVGPHDSNAPNVSVTIEPQYPTVGEDVRVDASRTTDPDHDVYTYHFRVQDPSGQVVHEYEGEHEKTTFQVRERGTYRIRITAIDEHGHEDSLDADVSVGRRGAAGDAG